MSRICTFCSARESSSAGIWHVRPSCVGCRGPPKTLRGARVDNGYATSAGVWAPGATPARRNVCIALDGAGSRTTFIDVYTGRRDPMFVRKDIFSVCPRMVKLTRASSGELRSALLKVKKHLAPADTPGLEDVLGQGCDIPSGGTSFLLMLAQLSGAGRPAERVAMESADSIRLGRVPHTKCKLLLPTGAQTLGRFLEYFCRVARQTDNASAPTVATEREFFCESLRALHLPCAATGKGVGSLM